MGISVIAGFTGYIVYNKQEERKNKFLNETSSFKSEVEKLNSEIEKLSNELEKAKVNANNLSNQNEEFSQVLVTQDKQITEQNAQADRERVCGQANDLLLEIKQVCGVQPFPGVNECIEQAESPLEYLGEENYKKYGIDEKVNNLKELKSRHLNLDEQCKE